MLSRRCEYAIRAALYLASNGTGEHVPIRDIGKALGLSPYFLTKIFQDLTRAGLMTSFRGPGGGVALARPAAQIRLEDIVVAIDGGGVFRACVLGLPGCGKRKPCPLHAQWAPARQQVHALFSGATLAALARRMKADDLRISNRENPGFF